MKFVKIKSIKQTDTEPIYHILVEKNHNFFGNNLCLHNCDYYSNPDNDGNIAIALYNRGTEPVELKTGDRVAQGVFTKYLESDNGNIDSERDGGIGSSGK